MLSGSQWLIHQHPWPGLATTVKLMKPRPFRGTVGAGWMIDKRGKSKQLYNIVCMCYMYVSLGCTRMPPALSRWESYVGGPESIQPQCDGLCVKASGMTSHDSRNSPWRAGPVWGFHGVSQFSRIAIDELFPMVPAVIPSPVLVHHGVQNSYLTRFRALSEAHW